jgi:hypothetical protein
MRLALTIAALTALGLAACDSKPAADGATASDPAAATTPAAPAATAAAAGIEGPAAGKWRMTMTTMGQTMPASELCYEKQVSFAEAEKMQQQAGVTCSEQSYRRDGDAFVGHSVCTMDAGGAPVKVTTETRVTGDFSSKYTIDMTSKMDPPPMPSMTEQKISIVSERIGDC